MMKITTPTKLTEQEKERLKKSHERTVQSQKEWIEEQRKTVITNRVKGPPKPSPVIDILVSQAEKTFWNKIGFKLNYEKSHTERF